MPHARKIMASVTIDFEHLDDGQLLQLYTSISREAQRRKLSFAVGEVGEKLAIETFKARSDLPVLVAAPRGTRNVDALSRDGDRYSIKTLQRARKTGTVYPDSTEPDRQLFEFLLVVLLADDLQLDRIVAFDWSQFCAIRKWDSRMRAWYVARTRRSLATGRQIFPEPPIGD